MKKLVVLSAAVALAVAAPADVAWTSWMENPEKKTDISFGIATKCANVNTFELSLLYSGSPLQRGVQWSLFGINDSDRAEVLQLCFWFNRGDASCVQLAAVNTAKENVFSLGFVNIADTAKVQIGVLNFNKNGFLPVFPFINLDKSLFGNEKK